MALLRRPTFVLLLCATALLAPAFVAAKSHGGEGTYKTPVAEGKAWKKYKFTIAATNEQTSFRPALDPYSPDDSNAPGSEGTIISQLYDEQGAQIGTAAWTRTVIDNVDGLMTRQLVATMEFGTEDDDYTQGAISFTALTKRLVPEDKYVGWTGIVNGGRGYLRGAWGSITISDALDFDPNLVTSAVYSLELYVPNDLPK